VNYYKRHIGDYAKRARRLNSPAQHGILLLLTDEYYDTEQPIPDATAHRIACCKREDVTAILEDFFVRDGEVWRCPEIDNVIEGYRSRYSTESVRLAASYAGVPELVAALAATERLAVCTSKPRRFAVPILEQLGMARHFAHIEGPGLTEVEPKTVTMERLRRVLPLDPSASVMVGDRHHDVEAALAHGLLPVGVTWGFGSRDELEAAGAVSVIDRPDELHEVLAGLG